MFTMRAGEESLVDRGDGGVLESPNPETLARSGSGSVAGANPGRKRNRLNRRSQFSLLIVRGDGVRVLRFNFARPSAVGAGVVLAVMVSVTGALLGDWVHLREINRAIDAWSAALPCSAIISMNFASVWSPRRIFTKAHNGARFSGFARPAEHE